MSEFRTPLIWECADELSESLGAVKSSVEFSAWVRRRLRRVLPHAAVLCTLGKLYGVGSVPTHRWGVDFPLNLVEELKNGAGAIDDPSLYAWFGNERPRYVEFAKVREDETDGVFLNYGMRNVLIHGMLDHGAKRFAVFQVFNAEQGSTPEAARLLERLIGAMANAAWTTIDQRAVKASRRVFGHPTLSLTRTELQIVELLAQGMSNKEIARHRGVSDSTVKTQISRTGAKVGASRRAEIVAVAYPMLTTLPPTIV